MHKRIFLVEIVSFEDATKLKELLKEDKYVVKKIKRKR